MSKSLLELVEYGAENKFEFVLARTPFSGYCDECPESNHENKQHMVCSEADGAGLKRLAYGLLDEVMSAHHNSSTTVQSQFKFDVTRSTAAQSVSALSSHIYICVGNSTQFEWWTTPQRRSSNIGAWFRSVFERGDREHRKPVVRLPIGKAIHSDLSRYQSAVGVPTMVGFEWSIEEPT